MGSPIAPVSGRPSGGAVACARSATPQSGCGIDRRVIAVCEFDWGRAHTGLCEPAPYGQSAGRAGIILPIRGVSARMWRVQAGAAVFGAVKVRRRGAQRCRAWQCRYGAAPAPHGRSQAGIRSACRRRQACKRADGTESAGGCRRGGVRSVQRPRSAARGHFACRMPAVNLV